MGIENLPPEKARMYMRAAIGASTVHQWGMDRSQVAVELEVIPPDARIPDHTEAARDSGYDPRCLQYLGPMTVARARMEVGILEDPTVIRTFS